MRPLARHSLLAILVTVLCLIASGCGSTGDPGGFLADPGPIDPTLIVALGDGANSQEVPVVQRSFIETCVRGDSDAVPELDTVAERGLLRVCGCSYHAFVTHARSEALKVAVPGVTTADEIEADAYERFKTLNADLTDGSGEIPEPVETAIAECIRREAF